MKLKHRNLAALTCASLLGSAALSQGAVLWADNFATDHANLAHQGGGTGLWPGNWFNVLDGSVAVTTGVMTGNGNIKRDLGGANTFATVAVNATIWVAFDWGQVDPTGGVYGGLTFLTGAGAEKALIGNTWAAANWSVTNGGSTGVAITETRKSAAAKITLGAGANDDTIQLWVQDAAFSTDANSNPITSGTALATGTGLDLGDISLIRVLGNNAQTFDNLVISTVPEPSAALLGGLGMLALLRRRRA